MTIVDGIAKGHFLRRVAADKLSYIVHVGSRVKHVWPGSAGSQTRDCWIVLDGSRVKPPDRSLAHARRTESGRWGMGSVHGLREQFFFCPPVGRAARPPPIGLLTRPAAHLRKVQTKNRASPQRRPNTTILTYSPFDVNLLLRKSCGFSVLYHFPGSYLFGFPS